MWFDDTCLYGKVWAYFISYLLVRNKGFNKEQIGIAFGFELAAIPSTLLVIYFRIKF